MRNWGKVEYKCGMWQYNGKVDVGVRIGRHMIGTKPWLCVRSS